MEKLPHRQELMGALIKALNALGGSGAIEEIREQVIQDLSIPDHLAAQPHRTKSGEEEQRSQLEYDLAWARTALKELGYLENSVRGVWALTAQPPDGEFLLTRPEIQSAESVAEDTAWRDELLLILQKKLTPAAFEHLVQRMLRETGFTQVVVTGRSGDGGIDGRGIAKINGILSFHVVFQCKRYSGSISPSQIRDFRGAMIGRADKGLFITTGTFSREALKEATRDGTVAIDLVDGLHLCQKLRELRLGVNVETVEKVSVNGAWFDGFNKVQ